jgi:hypothetical protein
LLAQAHLTAVLLTSVTWDFWGWSFLLHIGTPGITGTSK